MTPDASSWPLGRPKVPVVAAAVELARILARRRRGISAVQAYQLDRLRALVAHAAARVPAYRGTLTPQHQELGTLANLERLPIVDKAYFIERGGGEWLVPGAPMRRGSTSGTTGQPFAVPWPERARWQNWVQSLWMMRCMRAPFIGAQIAIGGRDGSRRGSGVRSLLNSRRVRLPETMPVDETAERIRQARPAWVAGQAHVLAAIGSELRATHRPRLVTTHGISADDLLRDEITAGFGVAPLDIYGAMELQQIAWQCWARDLYHLNHETVYAEVVDDDGRPVPPGTLGHLVLTTLTNPLLPVIRYRIGDSAVFADRPCRCGEALPALERVEGRTFDWLVDDKGQRVAPQRLWLATVIDHRQAGIARYRVQQDADRRVTVEIVPRTGFDPAFGQRLLDVYRVPLGATTPLELRVVDRIDVPPGERFRQFTSTATPTR